MKFVFGFLATFLIGGSPASSSLSAGRHPAHQSYYVVAHLHYVLFGGSVSDPGGIYYWFPRSPVAC